MGGSTEMMYVVFCLRTIIRITPIVVVPSQTYVYIRCLVSLASHVAAFPFRMLFKHSLLNFWIVVVEVLNML